MGKRDGGRVQFSLERTGEFSAGDIGSISDRLSLVELGPRRSALPDTHISDHLRDTVIDTENAKCFKSFVSPPFTLPSLFVLGSRCSSQDPNMVRFISPEVKEPTDIYWLDRGIK